MQNFHSKNNIDLILEHKLYTTLASILSKGDVDEDTLNKIFIHCIRHKVWNLFSYLREYKKVLLYSGYLINYDNEDIIQLSINAKGILHLDFLFYMFRMLIRKANEVEVARFLENQMVGFVRLFLLKDYLDAKFLDQLLQKVLKPILVSHEEELSKHFFNYVSNFKWCEHCDFIVFAMIELFGIPFINSFHCNVRNAAAVEKFYKLVGPRIKPFY